MQIYLDCDGVLADFEGFAEGIFGEHPRQAEERIGTESFWAQLRGHRGFFREMGVLPEGRKLFEAVKHWNPIILTGCPEGGWAEVQKEAWVAEHFPGTKILCCMSQNKRDHLQPGDILIDDYLKYRHLWTGAGGVFIHFQNADQALQELNEVLQQVQV